MFREFEYFSDKWALFFDVASDTFRSVLRVAVDDVGIVDVVWGVSSVYIWVLDVF